MAAVTKLRIKLGGSIRTFQTFPEINNCSNAKKIEKPIGGDDVINTSNLSKKRGPEELEEVQANKKTIKLDRGLSSQCFALLRLLREHQLGWIFNEPVDPVKLKIPDYFTVILKPMDLGTIRSKLLNNAYNSPDEFAEDVRLTFTNAMMYNPPDNSVHKMAKELKELFEVKWESAKKKKIPELFRNDVTEGSKGKPFKVDCSRQSSPETSVEFPKPVKEKSSILLKPVRLQSKKDTPVITPRALPMKLRIKNYDQGLGVGLTVDIPCKGSAPTEACKCGSCGRRTCICLKSCNSSGSEVSSLTDCQVMNTSSSQASESELHSNGSISSKNDKIGCVSSQLEKPSVNELKTKLPVLPPLPPEKALRAAILKGQFAETILKAKHRKVLDKSNKVDLIRIQIEKEQMERTQRQEKARIEAEMREAKIATRMRAVNELKQQRERQRLELEQMKKTYDFEANNYMKLEEDLVYLCGSSNLTRSRLFKELGLYLREDDYEEYIDLEISGPMRVDDVEEGEIL